MPRPILLSVRPSTFLEGPPGTPGARSTSLEGPQGTPGASPTTPDGSPGARGVVDGHGAPRTITGGGLVAIVDEASGLRGLWRGATAMGGRLSVSVDARPLPPAAGFRSGPGSWSREIHLPGGAVLHETGLVPDLGPAAVLQWRLQPLGEPVRTAEEAAAVKERTEGLPRHLAITLAGEGEEASSTLHRTLPPREPIVVAILATDGDPEPERAQELLHPLRARELLRADRGSSPGFAPFRILVDGRPVPGVEASLRALDDAPLGMDLEGRPMGPFLAGLEEGAPRFLDGSALAELGMAALTVGRAPMALSAIEDLARRPDRSPIALLTAAAHWALWTGDPGPLSRYREALAAAASAAQGTEEPPAAFPSAGLALERLLEGLEPLGEVAWVEPLRSRHRAIMEGPAASAIRRLPVLGSTPAVAPHTRPRDAILPPPEAFAHPDAAGFGARRTLQAVRILRSWVEGRLGACPDAAYGRLRLGPRLAETAASLRVEGIRVGRCAVTLEVERAGPGFRFRLGQSAGHTPLNLVFAPVLPNGGEVRVEMGGKEVQVEITHEEHGTRIRCQFPLDPERELTITPRG